MPPLGSSVQTDALFIPNSTAFRNTANPSRSVAKRCIGQRLKETRNHFLSLCIVQALLLSLVCMITLAAPVLAQEEGAKSQAPNEDLASPQIAVEVLSHRLVPMTKDELKPLALAWRDIVQAETRSIAEKKVSVFEAPDEQRKEVNQEIARMTEARMPVLERYAMVVDAYERKGGDPELVADLRTYRDAIILDETSLASPKAIFLAIVDWATRMDGGIAVLKDMGIVILAAMGLLAVARTFSAAACKWIGRVPTISKLLETFLVGVVFWLVLTLGLLLVLAGLGVNIAPIFAMIGGASFILAFALQDTLGNLASGLMIMINQPFDEGDYVEVGGVGGTVKSVSIVATTIATPDNQIIVIPNKNVWGNVITNVTASKVRRVDLVFGISYKDSIPAALEVMERVVKNHPAILNKPQPTLRVHQLAESSVNVICRPWVKSADYWDVYWDLTHQMKEAFDDAGISIPYPQRDVHMKN
ncbi:mechanosensitive ion channel family protein [Marinobacter sp. F4216]|uniref:mechanosensitive ion channel family protein n=1 Tax=Marinobacter sp. F4216 TaxID=2874281 RepID=UPI001CC0E4E9|nr:mechanosensitive ion channel domain-containing protein [Marinobacter sp. F4216]MBZ2168153.1 mechanosensitive ion channel [Marinobacter sp. F4216]